MNTEKQIINDAFNTYCNPLSLPDIPLGDDDRMILKSDGMWDDVNLAPRDKPDYRSVSDPTVMYYDNKWYLYPSYGMAWVTENFKTWKHVKTTPYCPKYSPCITKWGDKFLMTSWDCPLYVADNPLGPFTLMGKFIMPDGTLFNPIDPAIFTDDDGRIYLYGCMKEETNEVGIHSTMTVGYELDKNNPRQVIKGPVKIFGMNSKEHPWERFGYSNQNTRQGWIEGAHVLKVGSRYYCIYATPGTVQSSYCMAVYYSDEGPLSGFVCQKKNPLTINKYGIVSGAGHGCVEKGPGDTLWAFYTITNAGPTHRYERRIGMDLVAVDENGELYCPHGVTDTPQYIPGYSKNPVENNDIGYLPLNIQCRPTATSSKPGRDSLYAVDASGMTWWESSDDDKEPTLTCALGGWYYVGASRVFWHETGLCYSAGALPGTIKYVIEGRCGEQWIKLFDNREETEEYNIDYRTFTPVSCDMVRITITEAPKGIHPGIVDFTVFGVRDNNK